MNPLAVVLALALGGHPIVLSPFGARCALQPALDGSCRRRPFPHDGADFGPAEVGDPVLAAADGRVIAVVTSPLVGGEIVIAHRDGHRTGYMHLRRSLVHVGERVRRGQAIGTVGLFWASDGVAHVHWRLWEHGRPIDPTRKAIGCFDPSRDFSRSSGFTFPLAC
jgi:murein DD-endopeptidase MepM/ murein hydrolase activator NlpD